MSKSDIRKCYECSFLVDRCGAIGRCVQDELDPKNISDISMYCMYDFPKEKEAVVYPPEFGQGIKTAG
jgi:hypothetical protein